MIEEEPKARQEGGGRPVWIIPFIFPVGLLWMELVIRYWDFGGIWNRGLLCMTLFTVSAGFILAAVSCAFGKRTNRILSLVFLGILTAWYMIQAVYYTVFKTVFGLYLFQEAGDAAQFWRSALLGIRDTLPALTVLTLPLLFLLFFGREEAAHGKPGRKGIAMLCLLSALLYGGGVFAARTAQSGVLSTWAVYKNRENPTLMVSNFGTLTALRMDVENALSGALDWHVTAALEPVKEVQEEEGEPNVMNLDLNAMAAEETNGTIRDMDQYFAARKPTMKNQYTGMFQGKNLIFITAEAFSSLAVDQELTPTLYKLSHEGFVFQNFYNPLWWTSTSDGEYVACTGLIPRSGTRSFAASAQNSMYFCLGHQFAALGYKTLAYHDHTYSYYDRNKSHPNMGYEYKGVGNGLKVTKMWPESDLEMMKVTVPELLDNVPFHAYYMTVSGHLEYNFMGNSMAKKHQSEVAHLKMSEPARAYLACQMELDQALQYLLAQLDQAGQLENTVICLSGDHYPYGLPESAIDELKGHPVQDNFDLYHSTLILWSGDMVEPVTVEKTCSSLDIMPTLSNLFELTYDSRLLMGRDILSDSPGLAVFSDNSFVTDLGRYDAGTDTFTPVEGSVIPPDYAANTLQEVQDMFTYSGKILQNNYYAKIGLIWP